MYDPMKRQQMDQPVQPEYMPEQQAVIDARRKGPAFKFQQLDPNTPQGQAQSEANAQAQRLGEMYLKQNPGATYESMKAQFEAMQAEGEPEEEQPGTYTDLNARREAVRAAGAPQPEQTSAWRGALLGLAGGKAGVDKFVDAREGRDAAAQAKFKNIMDMREQALTRDLQRKMKEGDDAGAAKIAKTILDEKRTYDEAQAAKKRGWEVEDRDAGIKARSDLRDKITRAGKDRVAAAAKRGEGLKLSPEKRAAMISEFRVADLDYSRATAPIAAGLDVPEEDIVAAAENHQRELQRIISKYDALQTGGVSGTKRPSGSAWSDAAKK